MPLCAAAPPLARSLLFVGGPQGEGQCGQERCAERQRDGLRSASPLETRKRHARKRQRRRGGACRRGPPRVAGAQPVETGPSEARFGKSALEPPPTGAGTLSPGPQGRVGEWLRGALPDSGEARCAVARGHRSSFHGRGRLHGPRRRRKMRGAWDVAHPFESANSLPADGCGKLRTWQASPPKGCRRPRGVAAARAAAAAAATATAAAIERRGGCQRRLRRSALCA